MSEPTTIDWESPPKRHGNGCRYSGCEAPIYAYVWAGVRLKGTNARPSGAGRQVASRQRGFCKEHAELVYAEMLKELPE